jgi:H+-transporting ATPase
MKQRMGLATAEAQARLAQFGRNEIPRRRPQPFKLFFKKLWGPIPWLLEATVLLELASRRSVEAAIVFTLLLINAVIGFFHEHRAQDAVEALRSRLHPSARVLRDGSWSTCDARDLVPDDVVHVRMGDVVPADLEILEGSVSVDESVLTGESLPVERSKGAALYSASTIKRGEATAAVRATGAHTKFGMTAELVRSGDVGGHLRDRVFGIVRYLIIADAVLLLAYLIGALLRAAPPLEILTFALTLLLGAIPVALPATFTLATALGATQLSRRGVLVTRLSAIEDAAVMDVLCVDKTGTLTENKLAVSAVAVLPGASEEKVLRAAALASDPATLDPLDLAILAECTRRGIALAAAQPIEVHPFDPERKYAETIARDEAGARHKAAKGSRAAIAALSGTAVDDAIPHRLSADGQRVLTVAEDDGEGYRSLGFVAFADTLRPDAADLIDRVRDAGVRVLMLTGDTLGTARAIATRVGLGERIAAAEDVRSDPMLIERVDVVARVLPEDKFAIVRQLQQNGHACGMTGDGVNDAPALQAAQVGIAVAGATDAAKAAASLVLTTPGLVEILPAIEESRRIFHRLSIYATNKVTKSLEIGVVLTVATLAATIVPLTPLLMILLIFGNDFATMAIAADRVTFSHLPEHWSSERVVRRGATFALLLSAFSLAIFFAARNALELSVPQIQTLMFLLFVCSSQGLIYLLRERGGFWRSRPSPALTSASIVDVAIGTSLAVVGILMNAIPISLAAALVGSVVVYLAIVGVVYAAAESGSMRT